MEYVFQNGIVEKLNVYYRAEAGFAATITAKTQKKLFQEQVGLIL